MAVNTNIGALVALQNLRHTHHELNVTQNRVSSGLKVATAAHDSNAFINAQSLRGDLDNWGAVEKSLTNAKSVVNSALAGVETVSTLVNQLRAKALEAGDDTLSTAARAAVNADFVALRDQLRTAVETAEFNGINLLRGPGQNLAAIKGFKDGNATTAGFQNDVISVAGVDLTLPTTGINANVGLNQSSSLPDAATARSTVVNLDTAKANINAFLGQLGSAARQIDNQRVFVSKLTDTIKIGISDLVDADLTEESAKLQALQTKQQLGITAIQIANAAPNRILQLFQ